MKRLTLIIMAGLLMLGLTQCKKEQTNTNANAEGEWVNITVKVDGGDRHIVYPGTGAVVYSDDDVIYVGNKGKYVGTLEYKDGVFSGSLYLSEDATEDYLHFYFIGGEYTGTLNAGTTESFDWSIADQSEKLPVLSYGHSTQKYTPEKTTYGCTLENQCALVEFTLAEGTSAAVTVGGMHTVASINFADGTIEATNTTDDITLYSESAESTISKWAILLPKGSTTTTTASVGGTPYTVTVPAVAANAYVHGTNAIRIGTPVDYYFSVGPNTKVQFSPGNLQYKQGEGWRFAAHQYDYVGAWNTADWVDLFGWGTWGASIEGGFTQNPLNTSLLDEEWEEEYQWTTDFQGTLDGHSDWRTLTLDEWVYLLFGDIEDKRNKRDKSFLAANITVGSISYNGVIVFPDNYDDSELTVSYPYNNWDFENFSYITVSDLDWTAMEAAGAVFLPAAGGREETYLYGIGVWCGYWSATSGEQPWFASCVGTDEFGLFVSTTANSYYGNSVRLVRNAN